MALNLMLCSIDGCNRPSYRRSWCSVHYQRWRDHGDPCYQVRARTDWPKVSPEERFWMRVTKTESCWVWLKPLASGYGSFHPVVGGPNMLAHRFSYELHRGLIPEGLSLDHLCRNPGCVNPDHLEAVPQATNVLRGFSPQAVNARKTACSHGHVYTEGSFRVDKWGRRRCKECTRRMNRHQYLRRITA